MEKAKKKDYHPSLKISKTIQQKDERWLYRRKLLVSEATEKKNILRQCHDSEETEYPGFKKTLRKVAEMAFWNSIRKETIQYVQNCQIYQKERESRKTGFREKMKRSEGI